MKRIQVLACVAATLTAIAGIMHLNMVQNSITFNPSVGIFFLVGGLAQLFWIIPTIRRWGLAWYSAGIGGTAVLIGLWLVTRMPENQITGRAGPINQNGIIVELMQAAFIALQMIMFVYEKRKHSQMDVDNTKQINTSQ